MKALKKLLKHSQPHDWFFRGAFRGKAPAEFLENYESPDQLNLLNLKAMVIESNHLQELKDSLIADLIITVPFKANPKQMVSYCIEHQSKPDPLMPIRTMRYKLALLSRAANEDPKHIPIVKSLVLYTGQYHYPDKTSLSSLSKSPEGGESSDKEAVFDLIWSREAEKTAKGKYYPLILKAFNTRYDKDLKRVEALFDNLSQMKSPGDQEFVKLVRRYVYVVHSKDKTEALVELESAIEAKKGGEKMQSAAECLVRLGSIQSIKKYKNDWKKQGKEEGKLEGVQQVALMMRKQGFSEKIINKVTAPVKSQECIVHT